MSRLKEVVVAAQVKRSTQTASSPPADSQNHMFFL